MSRTILMRHILMAAALLTANVRAQSPTPEIISIDATLSEQLTPHLASQNTKPIPPLFVTYSVFAKGNFGRPMESGEYEDRRHMENGLYQVTANRSDPNGSGGGGTALSLCGLTNVIAVAASRNAITGASVAAGAVIEMRFSTETESSSRLARLESSAPSLCNISPGVNFTNRTDGVNKLKIQRPFLSDKKIEVTLSIETDCKTPESKLPSSEISEILSGEYLRISCVTTNLKNSKDSATQEIAYLLDYHYYLPLKTTSSSVRTEISYSSQDLRTR